MEVFYINKYYRVNERIREPKLRVITREGENLGVIDTRDALDKARASNLDLVVIADKTDPPVAKILDFKKFLYEEKKKEAQTKAKSKKSELKELRFGPSIGEGDLQNKINRAKEFIEDGDRLQVTVLLKGRERAYPKLGFEKVERFELELMDIARMEKEPEIKGNRIMTTFVRK